MVFQCLFSGMLENSFILFLVYLDFGQISVTIIRYIISVLKKYFKSIPHHLKAFSYSYPVPQGTGPPSETKELVSVPIRGSAFRLICRAFSNVFFYFVLSFALHASRTTRAFLTFSSSVCQIIYSLIPGSPMFTLVLRYCIALSNSFFAER